MRFVLSAFLMCVVYIHAGGIRGLSLKQAIDMLERENIEIRISKYDEAMKKYDQIAVEGMSFGSLDLVLTGLRSNDAGNVFGFKLQSREATFRDFGFSDFLGGVGQALGMAGGNFATFTAIMSNPAMQNRLLDTAPDDLNYPGARNHFLTKLMYQIPLYTGGKLSEYRKITAHLYEMSRLDTKKLRNRKIFEVKKAFYDITLVERFIHNLSKIRNNVKRLKKIIMEMKKEGYTKKTDVLEVEARLSQVDSMLNQARLNRELAYQFLSFLLNKDVSSIRKVNLMVRAPKVKREDIERLSIDIQKAKMGLEVSEMAVRAEKANFLPVVGAFAEYGSADNVLWNDFGKKDFYTVGMQVKWNLFHGGTDKANLEKARVNMLKVASQVELAKRGIALKVKKLQTEIRSLGYDVSSQRTQLKLAREVYRTYEEKYKIGLASITDVLIKQATELEVLLKFLDVANKRSEKIFELQSILDMGGRS